MNNAFLARLHSVISAALLLVDDRTATVAPELFDSLKQVAESGAEIPLVPAGKRINWKGTLKRAALDLWDTPENNPDNAPQLWEDLDYKDGWRTIPEAITVTTAFAKDECGWWRDALYRSRVDSNVYTPEQYPENWETVVMDA